MADTLHNEGLRRYGGPFDWIYSNVPMIMDCLEDDFEKLLDQKLMLKRAGGPGIGHKFYGPMLSDRTAIPIVFPHHNPMTKDHKRFQVHSKRFLKVLQLGPRKFFGMCEVVNSSKVLDKIRDVKDEGSKFGTLFEALCDQGVTNFELLVVLVACGNASEARGEPIVKPSIISQSKGRAKLRVDELHCVGACTGLKLKNKKDATALGKMITKGRTFDLQPDPLEAHAADQIKNKLRD